MPLNVSPNPIFPLYLLPSLPFRRRSNDSGSRSASASPASPPADPPPAERYLQDSSTSILSCKRCYAQICPTSAIISKGFTGRHGRAYLVAPPRAAMGNITPPGTHLPGIPRHHEKGNLPNTHVHKPMPRLLVTGPHTVSDITCVLCGIDLGWKYVDAEEESQKYKVGMFILETKRITRCVDWETGVHRLRPEADGRDSKRKDSAICFEEPVGMANGVIEFDSGDEDECEDLFLGLWTPSLARKRRRAKAWEDEREIV